MKKLVSLLLTLALLCGCIVPACAEIPLNTIPTDYYMSAIAMLISHHTGLELSWESDGGVTIGSLRGNPIVYSNDEGFVTRVTVVIYASASDDYESAINAWMVFSTFAAAAPDVINGATLDKAVPGASWDDLRALMRKVNSDNPSATGEVNGIPARITLKGEPDGTISITFDLFFDGNIPQ